MEIGASTGNKSYKNDVLIYHKTCNGIGGLLKLARIIDGAKESFIIVKSRNMVITRDEIVEQTGLIVPLDLERFLFSDYAVTIKSQLGKLKYKHKVGDFELLQPIKNSFKIICLAFNYNDQSSWLRFGKNPPVDPVIYMKPRTSLNAPYGEIICPSFVRQLDYEGELAVLIGKKCKHSTKEDAYDYVAGYFVINDVSARDIQFVDTQQTRAKGFDTFGPCGPWITTKDEVPEPCKLRLTTRVNGELRQDSSTRNLVMEIDEIIYRLSKVMTLEPGDIIATGTPSGTGISTSKLLRDGDVVEVSIEKLGKIKNTVRFINDEKFL